MPRWLYGGAIVVYMAGIFGFAVARHISGDQLETAEALLYGAAWPATLLRILNIL